MNPSEPDPETEEGHAAAEEDDVAVSESEPESATKPETKSE